MEKSLKLFAAAVALALASETRALAVDDVVLFYATYVGSVTMSTPTPCEVLERPTMCATASIEADGVSTELGRSKYKALHALHLANEAGCWAYPHTEDTLTAANGDTLVLSMDGMACPTESPGAFDAVGKWDVLRGTGRFAGVTGHGTFDGHPNVITEHGSVTLEGWLSTPNR
jgi:hypothetical protein